MLTGLVDVGTGRYWKLIKLVQISASELRNPMKATTAQAISSELKRPKARFSQWCPLKAQVSPLARQIAAGRYSSVTLEGYTELGGNSADNGALSTARATQVKIALVAEPTTLHVKGLSFTVVGRGGTNKFGGSTANRCVVVTLG